MNSKPSELSLSSWPVVLVGALLVTGCGPMEDAPNTRTITQPIERICGADKYQGPQGVDVSTYQQNFDWTAREQEGIEFGVARVSNGTQIIDDYFDRNWEEMESHGVLRGAYQYFRPGQDAAAQANLMVDKLGRLGPGDLPAVIDVETADGQSPATVRQKVRTWLQIVEEGTGKRPMIYTAAYFWRDSVGDTELGDYPLWIANYGADCPLTPDGWDKWTMWQYCDGNPDYCSNGVGFDRDVFNGTSEELQAFAGGGTYGAQVLDQSFPVDDAVTVVTGDVVEAWIEVENTGTAVWDSETLLGTTEPRDRESPFAADDWVAPNRVASVGTEVEPGVIHRFEFSLQAPTEPGSYRESFGLVQEGVTWFSDPGQEGPADDAIQIAIEVVEPDDATMDPDVTDPPPDDIEDPMMQEEEETPPIGESGLPALVGPSAGVDGGCAQAGGDPEWFGLFAFLAFAFRRRRG